MIYRTRVSGWIICGWVIFWTLCAFWAGEILWALDGVVPPILYQLAALTGLIYMLMVGPTSLWIWAGVTINFASPAAPAPAPAAYYPNLNTLNADTWTFVKAQEDTWVLRYSTEQFRALKQLITEGFDNFPYRRLSQMGFSRDDWENLRKDLVRAGLAKISRGKLVINEDCRQIIFKRARTPLPDRWVPEES